MRKILLVSRHPRFGASCSLMHLYSPGIEMTFYVVLFGQRCSFLCRNSEHQTTQAAHVWTPMWRNSSSPSEIVYHRINIVEAILITSTFYLEVCCGQIKIINSSIHTIGGGVESEQFLSSYNTFGRVSKVKRAGIYITNRPYVRLRQGTKEPRNSVGQRAFRICSSKTYYCYTNYVLILLYLSREFLFLDSIPH